MTHPNREELAGRLIGFAVHDDDCTVNRFPGYDACSCGLSSLIQEARHAAALRQSPSVILWQTNDGQGWWEVEDPEFWKAKGCPVRGLGVVTGEEDARQSPSVEEVARVIDPTLEGVDLSRPCWPTSRIGRALAKAQAIADLFPGRGG